MNAIMPVEPHAFVVRSYLLKITDTQCKHCNSVHKRSDLFAVFVHPTLTAGSAARKLIPTATFSYGALPVDVVETERASVATCHSCVATLPHVEHRPHTTEAGWSAALQREAQLEQAKARLAATQKVLEQAKARLAAMQKDLDFSTQRKREADRQLADSLLASL